MTFSCASLSPHGAVRAMEDVVGAVGGAYGRELEGDPNSVADLH